MAEADPKIMVPVGELRANLRRYLKKVEEGASFVIMSRGKAVAVLKPDEPEKPRAPRTFGRMKGQFTVPDDFNTLPDDVIDSFYDSKIYGET